MKKENFEEFDIRDNVLLSGFGSFGDISIPKGIERIEDEAFFACDGITGINVPNSTASIGESAFEACIMLSYVIISREIKSLEKYAFRSCKSLRRITYGGTKEMWEKIKKACGWDADTGEYIIECTDGYLKKAYNSFTPRS